MPVILPPDVKKVESGQEEQDQESRKAYLEAFMREEFQSLMENLDESPYPAVEEDIARLLSLGSGFTWEQKYMFTEFGLALRRKAKFRLTLASHMRAAQLAPDDEHVLFNVARALYDTDDISGAREYLRKALDIAPGFKLAADFLRFLSRQKKRA